MNTPLSVADGRVDFLKLAHEKHELEKAQERKKQLENSYRWHDLPGGVRALINEGKAGLADYCQNQREHGSESHGEYTAQCSGLWWALEHLWIERKGFGFRAARPSDFSKANFEDPFLPSDWACMSVAKEKLGIIEMFDSFYRIDGAVLPYSSLATPEDRARVARDIDREHIEIERKEEALKVSDLYEGSKFDWGVHKGIPFGQRYVYRFLRKQDLIFFKIQHLTHGFFDNSSYDGYAGSPHITGRWEEDLYGLCWKPKEFSFDG